MSSFKGKKCAVVITGASKGFGQAVALDLAKIVDAGSCFYLTARSMTGLEETSKGIGLINSGIKCRVVSMDQKQPEKTLFEDFLSAKDDGDKFEAALMFHNAGSTGNQGTTTADQNSVDDLRSFFDTNLVSCILLNSVFLHRFSSIPAEVKKVINVSSLFAITPQRTWSLYCTSKAARDMFFRVMATEEGSDGIRVLNYAPGPMDTQMITDVLSSDGTIAEVKTLFSEYRAEKKLLVPAVSAAKLVRILLEEKYASGDHCDYFDDI
jgi:sepiapterin reductase